MSDEHGKLIAVSIHAPVRERRGQHERNLRSDGFNPRPRKGATRVLVISGAIIFVSIHAPVRERQTAVSWISIVRRFNPRPRKGATPGAGCRLGNGRCFNPRPRKGATRPIRDSRSPRQVSIHAPVRERRTPSLMFTRYIRFQSTPP